jgi:hypothetical protein
VSGERLDLIESGDLRDTIRLAFDPSDRYGSVMGAWFAIAGLLVDDGEDVPSSWDYRPSPMGGTDPDDSLAEWIRDQWLAGYIDADDLRQAGDVLRDYAHHLDAIGASY